MHSMTTATAANPPAPPESGSALADVLNWLGENLPGGNFSLIGAVVVAVLLAKGRKGKGGMSRDAAQRADKNLLQALKGIWSTLVSVARAPWAVIRFYGGYETRGERRSNATFLKAGTLTTPRPLKGRKAKKAAAEAVSVAALGAPTVSLIKTPPPRAWAKRTATWITSYRGRGTRALTRALRLVLAAVRLARRVHRAYRAVAAVAARITTTAASWHCWPYALRGLTRLLATAAALGLLVPAWRTPTLVLLALLAVALVVAAATTTPKPQELGDDDVYGPRIWAVLRGDLSLPEDETRTQWLHLPARLAAPGARIVIRLPGTFRGTEIDRQNLTALINSRIPGEWVGRFTLTRDPATAVYTHKPPPRPAPPEPQCPDAVDLLDPRVREILAALGPDEFYLGQDEFDRPVIQKMTDEQAHWALSVGSGGGKSAFLQWLAIQMLMKRGTIIGIDPKMVSLTPLIGVPGIHVYGDPRAPKDMRSTLQWIEQVVAARNYEKKRGTRTDFEPLYVFLEECNHLADILKEEYSATKESGASAGDPIWRDAVAPVLRLGREVNVHIIAVFQDFKDTQFGGVSLVPLFPLKIMGSYSERQWKRIMGTTTPMPTIQKKAGRMVLTLDTGETTRIQVPYVAWDPTLSKDANQKAAYALLATYYTDLRATHGYSTQGLYAAPPTPSPEEAPALIQALSRDNGPQGQNPGFEGGLNHETAGRPVTHQGSAAPGVTGSRDRLRLVPAQGGEQALQDPLEAPQLLTIAEAAREMQARGYVIKPELIRTHKSRRDKGTGNGFPTGHVLDGAEKFTLTQLIAWYEARGIEKRENETEQQEQDDAV
ncbi:hypothetical protein [Streptomyces sp. NPDC094049]|uniref:hypothetical protein n=1 Tax=Streptomyces sp. NPDC094049 TaxID=3154987 RepID=UPI00332999D8